MSSFLILQSIFWVALGAGMGCHGYDKNESSTITTIREFFANQGIPVSELSQVTALRYSESVLKLMKEATSGVEPYKEFTLNLEINKQIFQSQEVSQAKAPFTPGDETILRAVDLMVPNTSLFPIYEKAKEDLRKFYLEQPDACRELLNRFRVQLNDNELTTDDAAKYLRHTYNHWIPLARLLRLDELSKSDTR